MRRNLRRIGLFFSAETNRCAVYYSTSTLLWHLIRLGFASLEDVASGQVSLSSLPGRHHAFRVTIGAASDVFCKQARSAAAEFTAAIAREARFLQRVADDPTCAELRPFVPRLRHFEPHRHLLTTEFLAGRDYLACHREAGRANSVLRANWATATGTALGEFHRRAISCSSALGSGELPRALPPAISLDPQASTFFDSLSAANRQLLDELRRDSMFLKTLQSNKEEWRASTVMHGDIKWNNLLIDAQSSPLAVRIVDWELVDWGDPAWDVAGALHSYVIEEADERASGGDAPSSDTVRAERPVASFWHAYEQAAEPADPDSFRRRVIRFTAARLVQSILEREFQSTRLDESSRRLLARSRDLTLAPERCSPSLLGFAP